MKYKLNKIVLIIILTLFCKLSFAEYRVYQYLIEDNYNKNIPTTHIEVTTFDPISFQAYNGNNHNFHLLRTWFCPGYTGLHAEYCPPPTIIYDRG